MFFSIVIPVYNRPQEIDELLLSIVKQTTQENFEVIVVEDGSTISSKLIVEKYVNHINLQYWQIDNQGAGLARNFGMQKAKGDYFIILDSDVILPKNYLTAVAEQLANNYTDFFGGPDAAHHSFSDLQKAINFSMTSVFTTGGIRGNKKGVGKFQPRSFNMGFSKKAFLASRGFENLKAGEDIDLSMRLWSLGFKSQLISSAYVYHKRRNNLISFYHQTFAFGAARPVLNRKYASTAKLTYWFPSLFIVGFVLAVGLLMIGYWQLIACYSFYFLMLFFSSLWFNQSIIVGFLSIVTTLVQMAGYGIGFLKAQFQQ